MLKTTQYETVTRIDMARTIAGRGSYWTSAYIVDDMMIDTGCAYTAQELLAALKKRPVARIVNTHSHEDHIGANGLLQKHQKDLEILAHPLALTIMADPRATQPLHPYQKIMWGWPEPAQGKPLQNGDYIETENYRFEVIYTPGHSLDHICLFEAKRGWLFSGDLFVGGKDRALRANYEIWPIIASLKRIAKLNIRRLFPGSARVKDNPRDVLDAKIAYLEQTGQKVLTLQRQGRSIGAIARRLFGGPMSIEFFTLGHFSRRQLVLSYLNKNGEPKA